MTLEKDNTTAKLNLSNLFRVTIFLWPSSWFASRHINLLLIIFSSIKIGRKYFCTDSLLVLLARSSSSWGSFWHIFPLLQMIWHLEMSSIVLPSIFLFF